MRKRDNRVELPEPYLLKDFIEDLEYSNPGTCVICGRTTTMQYRSKDLQSFVYVCMGEGGDSDCYDKALNGGIL